MYICIHAQRTRDRMTGQGRGAPAQQRAALVLSYKLRVCDRGGNANGGTRGVQRGGGGWMCRGEVGTGTAESWPGPRARPRASYRSAYIGWTPGPGTKLFQVPESSLSRQ